MNFTGLPGAVIGYLIVMCILLVLLVSEYASIRMDLHRKLTGKAAPDAEMPRAARTVAMAPVQVAGAGRNRSGGGYDAQAAAPMQSWVQQAADSRPPPRRGRRQPGRCAGPMRPRRQWRTAPMKQLLPEIKTPDRSTI